MHIILTISIIIESNNEDEIKNLLNLVTNNLNEYIKEIKIYSIEAYDKILGATKVILDINTKKKVTFIKANEILELLADNWLWDDAKSSAISNCNIAKLFLKKINFIDVWFEDLDC